MKSFFANGDVGITGLVFFFLFFVGIVIWVMWPGTKNTLEKHGQIPLEDEQE